MKTLLTTLAVLMTCAGAACAQDKDAQRKEIDALRQDLNRTQDLLIEQARDFDLKTRKLLERLEQEQRKVQKVVRDGKLREKRLELRVHEAEQALARAVALLEKHGIEVPGSPDLKQRLETQKVTVDFPDGTTLADAVEFLHTVTQLRIQVRAGADRELKGGLKIKEVTIANVLSLLTHSFDDGEELSWSLKGETVVIDLKSAKKPRK